MSVKVAEVIVHFMKQLGIDSIFGMPGAHILPVYDVLYDSPIESVLAKHEQGASFMAGGYARSSGRVGACITTAGPGATNLVTGIANAYADKLPVLAITGEAPTHVFGKGGLQESSGEGGSIDQNAIFKGITRYHKVVERSDYLINVLNHCAHILLSDVPGPVVLSFPFNIQNEELDESVLDDLIFPSKHVDLSFDQSLHHVVEAIDQAKAPIIVAGYGCIASHSQTLVTELSELLNIPVTSSLKAKGSINERSPLSLGSLGVTSRGYAHSYIKEHADLIIFLGASFNERTSYVWKSDLLKDKKVIQVDLNAMQLEKVFKAHIPVRGEIHAVLQKLISDCKEQALSKKAEFDFVDYKSCIEAKLVKEGSVIFNEEFTLVEQFYDLLGLHCTKDTTVFDDNIIYAQSYYQVADNNHFYPNSGISSLGHAIPAAIGASFFSDGIMFAILGDGGFQMCCMELMTAVNYKKSLNVVMFNNQTMGLIRKNQSQQYHKRYIDCDFVNPDFQLFAKSFGIKHKKIQTESEMLTLFSDMDVENGINLIEIMIDKDAFPNYTSNR